MGDLFDEYNNQLKGVLTNINNQVELCKKGLRSTTNKVHLKELDSYISSAEEMLRQMELEARLSVDSLASERMDQIRVIRSKLKEASETSRAMSNELMRTDLIGDVNTFGGSSNYNTLQQNDLLLDKGLMYLKTSCAAIHEAEMMGVQASRELYGQGDIINRVKTRLTDTKLSLASADEYLCKLLKQGRLNKVVLYTVFGAIAATIIAIIIIRSLKFIFLFN